MRRVKEKVSLAEAARRLIVFRDAWPPRSLFGASQLADVIWPDAEFITSQGAGAAASRVLKKLGAEWKWNDGRSFGGWSLAKIEVNNVNAGDTRGGLE